MSKKFFHVLVFHLIFIKIISCRVSGDENYGERLLKKQIFKFQLNVLIHMVANQIKNYGLNQEDEYAFVCLIYILVQKLKAFKTPPVYWYSRKG